MSPEDRRTERRTWQRTNEAATDQRTDRPVRLVILSPPRIAQRANRATALGCAPSCPLPGHAQWCRCSENCLNYCGDSSRNMQAAFTLFIPLLASLLKSSLEISIEVHFVLPFCCFAGRPNYISTFLVFTPLPHCARPLLLCFFSLHYQVLHPNEN